MTSFTQIPDSPLHPQDTPRLMAQMAHSRRRFLKAGLLAAAACILPPLGAQASTPPRTKAPRRELRFYNTHTNESLEVCYCADGRYLPEGLRAVNHIMRDHRTGEVRPIDPRLLDLLHGIYQQAGGAPPLHIVSGYRSPATNAALRRRSGGVARRSLHMQGTAADIRIPELPLARLHKIALGMGKGGVGFYPKSEFVHVDIGQVRHW